MQIKKLLFTIPLLFSLFLIPKDINAQERSIEWKRWDSEIWINQDGSFNVRETFEIGFLGGPFTFGYRNIYSDQLEQILNFSMSEGSTAYSESYSESPDTFYVTTTPDEYIVNWFFPATTNQSRTFILQYQVVGGLLIDEDGDLLIWSVIGAEHDWDISSSDITVHMPPGAIIDQSDGPVVRGTPADVSVSDDGQSFSISANDIDAYDPLEVYVRFTHGVVPPVPPAWQDDYIWRETTGKIYSLAMALIGILVLIGGLGGAYFLWLFKGRDPRDTLTPEFLSDPPSSLPPGIAGTLLDEKSDLQDVVATVIDLSRRGYIDIIEKDNSSFGLKSNEFTYRFHPEVGMPEAEFERKLVKGIFGTSDFSDLLSGNAEQGSLKMEVDLNELQDKFYASLPSIQKSMYEYAVNEGLFPENPRKVRGRYIGLSIVGIVISIATMFCVLPQIDLPITTIACPFIALVLVFIVFAVLGNFMPRKTSAGSEAAAKWKAFKAYIKDIEKYADLERATEQFDTYLPYAIAFGVERDWINTFSRVPATPIPRWYMPRGYYPSTTSLEQIDPSGRKSKGFDSNLGRDIRGNRALPGSGLDRMSSGSFKGLSQMSAGLFSALNTTSQVFRSTPSSSGSSGSGGGFSSGGFSGGGFSSGGGGGAGFG